MNYKRSGRVVERWVGVNVNGLKFLRVASEVTVTEAFSQVVIQSPSLAQQ